MTHLHVSKHVEHWHIELLSHFDDGIGILCCGLQLSVTLVRGRQGDQGLGVEV